ncbi:MAG: helicase-related protein, partial [bacterium]|nr:helicase-related protein [bacterium]
MIPDDDPYNTDQILSLVQYLAEIKKESSIIFVPKKQLTRLWASSLAEKVNLSPASGAVAAVEELEESLVKEELNHLLNHGIAYHNADLDAEFRQIIETYFRNGEIRIVIATSTLAQGVNLAAKNAIIVPHTVKYSRTEKLVSQMMMGKAQFENCSGRVGRFGIEPEFGRAMLVAGNDHQRLSYWLWYIDQPFEKLESHFPQENLESLCLNLNASGWCKNSMELTGFISRMYRSENNQPENNGTELRARVMAAVDLAQQWNLIGTNPRNELEITALGRATALAGISFDTARHFMQWFEQAHHRAFSELEVLLVSAFSPDAVHFLFPFSQREARSTQYRTELMKLIFEVQEEDKKLFLHLLNQNYPPAKEKLIAMKKAVVLYHWITGMPTAELERGYRAYFGAISHLGAEFAWLVQSLAGLAQSSSGTDPLTPPSTLESGASDLVTKLVTLSDRLRYGVNESSLPLAQLNIPGLGRMRISRLVQQGYDTPEAIAELELDTLAKLITRPVAERLKQNLIRSSKAIEKTPTPNP